MIKVKSFLGSISPKSFGDNKYYTEMKNIKKVELT